MITQGYAIKTTLAKGTPLQHTPFLCLAKDETGQHIPIFTYASEADEVAFFGTRYSAEGMKRKLETNTQREFEVVKIALIIEELKEQK